MKKVFTMIVVACMAVATPSQAQVNFGLKAGVNVTNMSLDESVFDASNQAGFFVGPTVKFTLPVVGLGIDASALYDQRSAKLKSSSGTATSDEEMKQQSIQVPINLRYGVGLGDLASIYLFAGPQFGFNVGSKTQNIINNALDWRLKDSNFSVNVGLGVMLVKHLQVSANYNIACGTSGELTVANSASTALSAIGSAAGLTSKGKSNAWQIAVAYYF